MKKIAIFSVLGVLFGASVAMGALKVQEIKHYENIVVVQTEDAKKVLVYKFEDANNTCYIAYTSGWTNGNNTNLSCVNTPVVPVVKK